MEVVIPADMMLLVARWRFSILPLLPRRFAKVGEEAQQRRRRPAKSLYFFAAGPFFRGEKHSKLSCRSLLRQSDCLTPGENRSILRITKLNSEVHIYR